MRTSGRNLSPASQQRWVLALTSVASLMVGLDILVVTTALTTIRLRLGASIEELEWIVNAYTLSFAVLLMTASALGDRFGRRRLFLIGLDLFTVMSAACALAPTIGWLIVARAVQGAGSAMIMPRIRWPRRPGTRSAGIWRSPGCSRSPTRCSARAARTPSAWTRAVRPIRQPSSRPGTASGSRSSRPCSISLPASGRC